MIEYSEAFENELIPSEYRDLIPSTCLCGSTTAFTENLNFLECTNSRCFTKVGSRIEAMCKALQIDGFGETTSLELARRYKLAGPAQLILLARKYTDIPDIAGWSTKRQNVLTQTAKDISLWEYIRVLNLPGISSTARSLFDSYCTAEDFFTDLEEQQVPFIASKLGIKASAESSVIAVNVYNTLLEYKSEIVGCQKLFNIKQLSPDIETLNVCITQKVPGFANKPAFIEELKRRFGDKFNIVQVERVTETTHILVGDPESNTGKMKRAKAINEKAGQQMVFIGGPETVIEFISTL